MQIRPIRTEQDHDAALARIDELMGAKAGSAEGDELDVLVTLVCAYEEQHFPMDAPDPLTAIQFEMEQQGLTRKDLEPMIGSRARVYSLTFTELGDGVIRAISLRKATTSERERYGQA